MYLTVAEDLLSSVDEKPNQERSSFIKTVAKLLQQKERREVERAVGSLLDELKTSRQDFTQQIQDALVAAQIEVPDSSKSHPWPMEERLAAAAWMGSQVPYTMEHFERHAAPFSDSPLQMQYFVLYLDWRSHEPTDEMLGAALLPRLVSAFEQFLAGLIRTGLMSR